MNKAWFKEMSVYQIWPRSFKDGDGDGIGDLRGVLDKLDYIKSLGVDAIWFSPLYASPQKDFGYDISDYRAINPEYGTMDDFKAVLDGAHARGIKVIMDLVINHTSDQHEWFKKSARREGKYTDYYIWRPGKGKDGKKFPNNWMATFPGDGWEWNEERGEYYLHLFAVEQPDLNHDNPDVREEVKGILRFWLDMGIDGFREDVIFYISKKEGLPNGLPLPIMRGVEHYSPGPNLMKYLQEYREVMAEYPNACTVGEGAGVSIKKMPEYVGNDGDGVLDMIFCFKPMEADCIMIEYVNTGFKLKKLKNIYNELQTKMYGKAWNTNFLENHDRPRIISRYGSEKYRSESGKALAAMYTFLSGTHFIYQGQEIGMTNYPFEKWEDFQDVAAFSAKSLMEKLHIFSAKSILKRSIYASRDNARTPVQWTADDFGGFSTVEPWFHVNPNYKEINVAKEEADPNSILNFYRKALALRKEYKEAAVYGKFVLRMKGSKQIFLYEKLGDDGTKLTVIINMSDKNAPARRVKKYVPEGAKQILNNYNGSIADYLKPYEAHVYLSRTI